MMADLESVIFRVLERNLNSIWDGDVDAYRATTTEDVSFYEWYIPPTSRSSPSSTKMTARCPSSRVSTDSP